METKAMHSGEMCDALLKGGIGETVKLSGDMNTGKVPKS